MSVSSTSTCTRAIAALVLATTAGLAPAQPQETTRGDLVLRSSTVASGMIDRAAAARHGIEQAPDVGVLNVLLARKDPAGLRPVAAQVEAEAWSLSGVRQKIAMREVREDGRVSYVGAYDFLPREVIDFRITATPLDRPDAQALTLAYRDRMWRP